LYALNGAGLSAPTFTLANLVYNYRDQLIEKNLGYRDANNALQSIDYQYNTRGWLTAINAVTISTGTSSSSLLTPSMQGKGAIIQFAAMPFLNTALQQYGMEALPPPMTDNNVDLFSQTLTYESPDRRMGAAPQKNGNISNTVWQVAGRERQGYGFKYDELNRLTEANYYDITGTQSTFSEDNKFQEMLTYDLRGNIETLQRKGMNLVNGSNAPWTGNDYIAANYGLIDDLRYSYGTGNRLSQVTERSLPDKGFKYQHTRTARLEEDYRYDGNGNLIWDRHKNITSIEYNYLNLPLKIVIVKPNDVLKSGSIEFVYDATGVKLRKIIKDNAGIVKETWDYVNGVEYKNRILQRVAHSEGAVVQNDLGAYQHEYVLRDHLGNTRVTFRDGSNKGDPYEDWTFGFPILVNPNANNPSYNDGVVTKDDIVQINNYYPFGLNMEGDWNGAQGKNKYQYNEKEWNDDFGLGWNDYGARMYDPAVGRFFTQDRFAEKYLDFTPYQYAGNNPIKFIDVNGDSIWISYRAKDGSDQRHKYEYGQKYKGDNQYVKDFYTAANLLIEKGCDERLYDLATDKKYKLFVSNVEGVEASFSGSDGFGNIYWDPRTAFLTDNGTRLSPVSILDHELDHAQFSMRSQEGARRLSSISVRAYDNLEEKRVIMFSEQVTAKKLGLIKGNQVTSTNHDGRYYSTDSPISIRPVGSLDWKPRPFVWQVKK
jgi:RHS repeat-associated protein